MRAFRLLLPFLLLLGLICLLPGAALAATPTPAPPAPAATATRPPTAPPATATPPPPAPTHTPTAVPTRTPTSTSVPATPTAAAALAPSHSPTAPAATSAATPTQPTATPTSSATATPTAPPASAATAATTDPPTPPPTAPGEQASTVVVQGRVFLDPGPGATDDAMDDPTATPTGVPGVIVGLLDQRATERAATSTDDGTYQVPDVPAGTYGVVLSLPDGYSLSGDLLPDLTVGTDTPLVLDVPLVQCDCAASTVGPADPSEFVTPADATPATADAADPSAPDGATASPTDDAADPVQQMARQALTDLPLRFAEGRDLLAQVGRRELPDGSIWLGVPFRSQVDGSVFQAVNCGPASLTMVLSAFGLDVPAAQLRDYLNGLVDNYDPNQGTSLDVLSAIGRQAGLTPADLYDGHGAYTYWTPDEIRWHIQQGHPVITLVKYRDLPGHTSSLSDWDHYIVISGLTPNGFIYNDAAFSTTLGYGLEITDDELENAWDASSIPHYAVALALSADGANLSFPELLRQAALAPTPAPTDEPAPAPADAMQQPAPAVQVAPTPVATVVAAPTPRPEPIGHSLGLDVTPTGNVLYAPGPGPGRILLELGAILFGGWLLFTTWSVAAHTTRWARRPHPHLRALPTYLQLLPRLLS